VFVSYEKLMGSDKVDLILPPWGSNANFAVAPLANRLGYPMLAPTALSRKLVEMKLPYFFLLLQQPDRMVGALVDMLVANSVKTLAVIYVDDLFGLENYAALKIALRSTSIQIVEEKSYPGDIKDLSPVLRSIKDKNPDAFIGLSYPPDTILASKQSKEIGFNPKFYYASVGTAFQLYRNVMTPAGAEGVLGMGSWNSKTSPVPRPTSMPTPRNLAARSRIAGPAATAGRAWRSCRRPSPKSVWTARRSATMWLALRTRPSLAMSSSPAAKTQLHRAPWASGRTASLRWSGR